MTHSTDVLVVGGGIIGLTSAYFLAREGLRVLVVDKGDLGQEASWAGAGIIPPGNPATARTPFDQLRAHSALRFADLSRELRERTGIDNGYVRCGGLEISPQPYSRDHVADDEEWHGEGVFTEVFDEPKSRLIEPALVAGLGKAIFLPDMAQLRNPRHLKALAAGCRALGVILSPGIEVRSFSVKDRRVTEAQTDSETLSADKFLIATGAWTDPLLAPFGWQPGIRPVRGQIALLQPDKPILQHIIVRGSQYLVPRADGRVLVGSTEENVGFDKRTTAVAIHQLLELAFSLVPELAEAPLERCWAGLRPGSPDGLPFLGPVPDIENLFVAAGHFRAGIQLSIGTAMLIKEMLLGQPTTISGEPFRLVR